MSSEPIANRAKGSQSVIRPPWVRRGNAPAPHLGSLFNGGRLIRENNANLPWPVVNSQRARRVSLQRHRPVNESLQNSDVHR